MRFMMRVKAGALIAADGLHASSKGGRKVPVRHGGVL
jgi:hypothetical protein